MERNQNPDWYKLTKLMKGKGIISTGLTIPFIFGAYGILGRSFQDITELVNEVRNYQLDKFPVIQKCDVINQHVVAIEDKNIYHRKYIKDVRILNTKGDINLIISSNTNLGKSVPEVAKNLSQLYSEPIDSGKFSWNNREKKWQIFQDEEIALIQTIQSNKH